MNVLLEIVRREKEGARNEVIEQEMTSRQKKYLTTGGTLFT